MTRSEYRRYNSFSGKIRVAFFFLSIIPYLLAIYLFWKEKIQMTEMILLFSPLILFSILTGFSIIRRSADQLGNLADQTRQVDTGENRNPVRTNHTDQELNDIATHFNSLFSRLQNANIEIREQSIQLLSYAKDLSESYQRTEKEKKLRDRLSRYVRKDLVEKILNSRESGFFENERREVTVLFADIRGFTAISERMNAEELVFILNQFLTRMTQVVFRYNGVLDKFIGDEIMAVFGLLPSDGNGAEDAVKAALEMQQAAEKMTQERLQKGEETFSIGIGINTGTAALGNIGYEGRMDYTVIGDSVNVAASLQQATEGGQIFIGRETFSHVTGRFRIQERPYLLIKNRTEPLTCYEVLPVST
ncbi:MAG: adenylate/guanylate cyclase domain-containing protein [Thermodesulfobacteriota bacterium]